MLRFVLTCFLICALVGSSGAISPPEDGSPIPDHVKAAMKRLADNPDITGVALRLQDMKAQKEAALEAGKTMGVEVLNATIPVLMGEYTDRSFIFSQSDFQTQLFGANPTGSMTDYFDEVSYGQFHLTGTVYGAFASGNSAAYYASIDDGLSNNFPNNGAGFVWDVASAADATIDFSLYDNDGPDGIPNSGDDDGEVDVLTVVCPGGTPQGGEVNIWAHASSLTGGGAPSEYTTNDPASGGGFITINSYTVQQEERGDGSLDQMRGIGVWVHEYGHKLGIPDLYDRDGSSLGLGRWCLMATGNYGAGSGSTDEDKPTHMSAWCKVKLGWVIPTEVSTAQTINIPPVETTPTIYKLWEDGFKGGRYFLLENRTQSGFDGDLYGEGMMIYHCNDLTGWDNSDDNFRIVDLEEADGQDELDFIYSSMDIGDPYPGYYNVTQFDDNTYPSAKDAYGEPTGIVLENIAYTAGPGSNISVDVTPRETYGYTLSYHGHTSIGGWGSSSPTTRYGALEFTAGDGGELVRVMCGYRQSTLANYQLRIFDDMLGLAPVGLNYTQYGVIPGFETQRYYPIDLTAPVSLSTSQGFLVDIAIGPITYAVPFTRAAPATGNSYYSSNGGSYSNWLDKDVLYQAQILTNCVDDDADGVCAFADNCLDAANAGQEDFDGDGIGDACDACPNDAANDADGDGYCESVDNCPGIPNPLQIDDNGNGIGDACECTNPRFTFTGTTTSDFLGWTVAPAGDVNNDGYDDIFISNRLSDVAALNAGQAYVFSGHTGDTLFVFTGEAEKDNFGAAVSTAGDINGDGHIDLLVGAYRNDGIDVDAGRAYLFLGSAGSYPRHVDAADADLIVDGEAAGDNFGWIVRELGDDWDSDGFQDFVVGAPGFYNTSTGKVHVVSGQTGSYLATYIGEAFNDFAGYAAAPAGDVNNDGIADVIIGAEGNDAPVINGGRAYVFYGTTGPFPISSSVAAADQIYEGEMDGAVFGCSVDGAGDFDNDGYDDLVVGAYQDGGNGYFSGKAYVFSGQTTALLYSISGFDDNDRLGRCVAGIGDIDNDSYDDIAVGVIRDEVGTDEVGKAYVISAQTQSIVKIVAGEADADRFGLNLAGRLDFDGDGYGDLIVGAYRNASNGYEAGRAYAFSLGGDPDGDNYLSGCDNCPTANNPGQEDSNFDGIGNACCCLSIRGNTNDDLDDKVNIADVTYMVSYLFGIPAGPAPNCQHEGNANGDPDEKVNIVDVTFLVSYLFGQPNGPAPPACP